MKSTVKLWFTNTHLIQTPHYCGQFELSPRKDIPYIFSKFNPAYDGHPIKYTGYFLWSTQFA